MDYTITSDPNSNENFYKIRVTRTVRQVEPLVDADFVGPTGLLPDYEIRRLATDYQMITPFAEFTNAPLSYGLGSYGYTMRVARDFKHLRDDLPKDFALIPEDMQDGDFVSFDVDLCFIPPGDYVLGVSYEQFNIPKDVLVVCVGKSTLARAGLVVNITPLEPEWVGYLTLEISNTGKRPVRIRANEGIAQLLFYRSVSCETTYADRKGRYQGQAATPVLGKGSGDV